MKRRIFAVAAAFAMALSTSATAVGAPQSAPAPIVGLEPCQVEYYHWCMARWGGDHAYCYAEAENTIC